MKKPCSASDPLWYKDAIIYELHVRAFSDANADGIGDFPGLISKLDYLQELGVTCLWLLPFFPSPGRDDGYDISNYTSVNPQYGTIEDFQQFLDQAHARNMQVMIELVINHTSDQHPWFQRARRAPKGSPDREMYVWSDTDKLYEGVRIIFTDTEKSNWTWDEVAQQYYWHRFFSHQPDLNFDNPRVMDEVLNAMRFWMDMGVDGLRLDAIPYLVERDGTSCENVPETHVKIKQIREVMDAEYENRLILAEANMWPADVRPYFGDGDECHMAFHFPLMPRIYMALRQEDRLPITDIMAQTPAIPAACQWGLFLRNHDELTLEMVTDDERDYMYLAYSADPRMRINVGIRRRLAPLVDNNRRRIELLNSLLLSFPGTPILYYGDEIGMGDNIYLGDRNGVRTPMQWNSDRNAGFSRAVPAQLYFPVIMDPVWGYQAINVEAQQSDPSSLLHWTRNMIALRKLFQVFGRGSLEFLHPENRKVLAYIREYDRADHGDVSADEASATGSSETVLCVANLSRFAQPVQLDLARYAGRQPYEMLGYVPFPPIDATPYAITLAPYSFLWLELQPAAPRPVAPTLAPLPAIATAGDSSSADSSAASAPVSLASLLSGEGLALLESLLPAYIAPRRWFGGKSRSIREVHVVSSLPLDDAAVLLVEVGFGEGESELYQLPLAVAAEDDSLVANLREHSPQSVIATLSHTKPPVVLYDASANPAFQAALLRAITGEPGEAPGVADLKATHSSALDASRLSGVPSRLSSAEQSNTSILYGEHAILKLFRHIRTGENPDVEISRFLTEVAHFPAIPAYLGDLALSSDGTTLAFLQAFAPNQGDGWAWTLDELARFYETVVNLPAPTPPNPSSRPERAARSGEPPAFGTTASPSPAIIQHAAFYLDAANLLGRRTAEMHLALATSTAGLQPDIVSAFAAEPYDALSLAEERERIEQSAAAALNALEAALNNAASPLPPESAALANRLLLQRDALTARLHALQGDPAGFGSRIRIHGDYHLGQLLRAASSDQPGFLIVDFEGEPARSLAERRRKQSPLRDVAGMVRSFSYAARSALDRYVQRHPDCRATLLPWAAAWESSVAATFLRGYANTIAISPGLLPAPEQADILLQSLVLEKAIYELLYELNNRPAWLPIPLLGLLAILEV